jgi:Bax protein
VKLREKEKPLRGISIAEGLGKYSVRGKAYIKAIRDMIRSHDLERYTLTTLEPVASRAKPA